MDGQTGWLTDGQTDATNSIISLASRSIIRVKAYFWVYTVLRIWRSSALEYFMEIGTVLYEQEAEGNGTVKEDEVLSDSSHT